MKQCETILTDTKRYETIEAKSATSPPCPWIFKHRPRFSTSGYTVLLWPLARLNLECPRGPLTLFARDEAVETRQLSPRAELWKDSTRGALPRTRDGENAFST